MPFAAGPDPMYSQTYWRGQKTMAKGAVTSLVVGILSLFCCGIVLGPIAIVQGSQARFRVRTSNGRLGGDGIALLGMFLGGLSVFLFFFWLWWYATGHSVLVIQRNGTTAADPPAGHSTRRSPLGAIDASAWGRSTTNSVRWAGKVCSLTQHGLARRPTTSPARSAAPASRPARPAARRRAPRPRPRRSSASRRRARRRAARRTATARRRPATARRRSARGTTP